MRQSEYRKLAKEVFDKGDADNSINLCDICTELGCNAMATKKCIQGISKGLKKLMEESDD